MKTTALLLALLCAGCASLVQQAKPAAKAPVAKGAPKTVDCYAVRADEKIHWRVVHKDNLEGRAFPDERTFASDPLSENINGRTFRFRSDATIISTHYQLLPFHLMSAPRCYKGFASSSLDLYARDQDGKWRWVQVVRPGTQEIKLRIAEGLDAGEREYAIYLPLYSGVEFLHVGVPEGKKFAGLRPRKQPVVFYGNGRKFTDSSSLVCASRPGMVHTAILGRRFEVPVVNFFSPVTGIGDANRLASIDASAYVIDGISNAETMPFVKQLRAARPNTPIILVEERSNFDWSSRRDDWDLDAHNKMRFHKMMKASVDARNAMLKATYEQLVKEGVKGLSYVPGDLGGADYSSHAGDLGFHRQADIFEPSLKAALGR
jgi:GDSL-like Lipase/Acylhydrolase family/N-terminus of Esterase_SGNH_hydro-type